MRKSLTLIITIIYACVLSTSCNDKEIIQGLYPPDYSLAGSVSFQGYKMEIEGSYNGNVLDNFQYDLSRLSVGRISDTEILLHCFSV